MTPPRVSGWPELLADYIEAARGRPFALGAHDCGSFAREWVRLAWGGAGAELFDGIEYAGERAACALMAEGIDALLTARLGEPVAPLAAQRGDLVAHRYGRVAVGRMNAALLRAAEIESERGAGAGEGEGLADGESGHAAEGAEPAAGASGEKRRRVGLGICLGAKFAAPAAGGLVFLPLSDALHAWRV